MGWGVLDEVQGSLRLVDYGIAHTPKDSPPAQRLRVLYDAVVALLQQHQPDAAAIEELFFSRNVTTALAVGQARGVVLLAIEQAAVPIYEYKPLTVKQTVAGYGGADKRQMQEMVRLTLRLQKVPRPDDAADALAIALCHAYTAPMQRRISESQ